MLSEERFKYRRAPAMPRRITEINPEKDIRVRIFGRVLDKSDGTLIVDDGSSSAEIVVDNSETVRAGDVVRIFARVLPLETGYELRGEVIQIMNDMDTALLRKIELQDNMGIRVGE
ncbi:MAG: replication protein RepA [Candidatus Aenigmarchaeota archaeon]|nr:replication protein RepA [Candidatus Aenigmarchaeota archaeon]